MAYNYFPTNYNPYAYQPISAPYESGQPFGQPNTQGRQNQPTNGLIWVQGEAGAKAYPVAPNTTVQLWDSENQIVYLKSADASGMPSMKILDYTIRDNTTQGNALQKQPQVDLSDYVTRDEFEKRISEMMKQKVVASNE